MSRCGRCGLFLKYEANETNDGICLWFDLPIPAGSAYTGRKCIDFMNWIEGVPIHEQLRIKLDKMMLLDVHTQSNLTKFYAFASLLISLIALGITIWQSLDK
jgi:hypothetical protein